MTTASEPADTHVLAPPRGRCRAIRRRHRANLALAALAVASLVATLARISLDVL